MGKLDASHGLILLNNKKGFFYESLDQDFNISGEAKHIEIINPKILVLGLSFKKNCNDIRNSFVFDLSKTLKKNNCKVQLYDPIVDPNDVKSMYNTNMLKKLPNLINFDFLLAKAVTLYPFLLNSLTTASPMPLEAPVTNAVLYLLESIFNHISPNKLSKSFFSLIVSFVNLFSIFLNILINIFPSGVN